MEQRVELAKLVPEGYRGVMALNKYVAANVDPVLFELIKIRTSMINGCAFCVDMHSTDAIAAGEDVRRIVALSTWRESPFFTEQERAVLDLTDSVTRLGEGGVSDSVWSAASAHLDGTDLSNVVLAIAVINVWNRIALSTLIQPPSLVVGG